MDKKEAITILQVKRLTSLGHPEMCEAIDMAIKSLEKEKEVENVIKEIISRIDQEILKPLTNTEEHPFTEETVGKIQDLIQSYL